MTGDIHWHIYSIIIKHLVWWVRYFVFKFSIVLMKPPWACSWSSHEHLCSWKLHEHAHEALMRTCAWKSLCFQKFAFGKGLAVWCNMFTPGISLNYPLDHYKIYSRLTLTLCQMHIVLKWSCAWHLQAHVRMRASWACSWSFHEHNDGLEYAPPDQSNLTI